MEVIFGQDLEILEQETRYQRFFKNYLNNNKMSMCCSAPVENGRCMDCGEHTEEVEGE